MFDKNQQYLRCLVMKNHGHDSLPERLPESKIIEFYREMCSKHQAVDCHSLRLMVRGQRDVSDEMLADWSTAAKWTNHFRRIDR